MALNKGENAGTIYLSVSNGRLVRQHKEANQNTTERVNKVGKTVYEETYKDLTGLITRIETKENNYGKQWQVVFEDGGERYMVQMPYSGRYSSSFLKALPNVTFGVPVRFMPWEMQDRTDAAKKVTGVTLYMNGDEKVLPAFTKEEPNGLPEMKKVKVKGKETWDDSDMMSFLEEQAKEWIEGQKDALTGRGIQVTDEEAAGEQAPF